MREFLLIVHILSAGAWFGTNLVQFLVNPRVGRAGPQTAAYWRRTTVAFGTRIYTPAAVLLLLTGIGLVAVSDGAYGYGNPFVSVGFAMVILGAVLGMVVFGPGGRKAAELHESGGGSELAATERRLAGFTALDMVLLVFTIVVMVLRWGA